MYPAQYILAAIHPDMPNGILCELNAAAVEGLAGVDSVILSHYSIPSIYTIRPRYRIEKKERWKDLVAVITDKTGDCKDFVAWRLAELRKAGYGARAESVVQRRKNSLLFHTFIRYDDGRLEDPARELGMP